MWPLLRPAAAAADNYKRGREGRVEPPRLYAYNRSIPAHSASGSITETRSLRSSPAATTSRATKPRTQERFRFVIATSITLAYIGLLGVMLYLSLGQVNVGLSATPTAGGDWVVTWVVPSGLSYDAGVRPGDIVVHRDGRPLSPAAPWVEVDFHGARSLTVESRQPSSTGQVITVRTEDVDSDPYRRWGYALLGFIFVGVGGPVFVKARQRTAASAFYAFCVSTAVALAIMVPTYLLHGWLLALMFATLVVWAASFAFFFLKFPVRVGTTPARHHAILLTLLGGGVAVLVAYLWVLAGHPADYAWVQPLVYLYMASCVAVGLTSLGRSLVAQRSAEVRRQLVLVLGGTALAVLPTLLFNIVPFLVFGRPIVAAEVTALALGIMPLAFAYAITQHQLLGVRSFVRRSVIYLVMGSTVLVVFSLAAAGLSAVMPEGWQKHELGVLGFGLFVFFIALSFGYLQRRVERLVDRYIYHDAYDYKEALLQFSTQLATEQNLTVLAHQLVERTCRLMNLTCGALLLTVPSDQESEMLLPKNLGLETVSLSGADLEPHYGAGGHAVRLPGSSRGDQKGENLIRVNGGHARGERGAYLEPYAKYGEYADWLIQGLQEELAQFGISLQQPDAPLHLIHLSPDGDHGAPEGIARRGAMARGQIGRRDEHIRSTQGLGPPEGEPADDGVDEGSVDFEAIRSFLGVPLWTRSQFVGVLCLGGKKTGERFTRDDLSLLSTLGSHAAVAIYNAQLYETREQALLDTIAALAYAIEAKDGYTVQHCEKMMGRAVALAQALKLPPREVENIRLGAILHDVGKIGIPDAILNKPGKLTPEEYERVKQHATIGARIVQSIGALQDVVPIVRHHQERYDGSGYPGGLAGEEIPIGARIIAVVDTYGAMTEDRVYRKAPGHDAAIAELARLAGKQFDKDVVTAFLRLLQEYPELAEPEYSRAT